MADTAETRLERLIAAFAADPRLAQLVQEAEAEAFREARALLKDLMVRALLDAALHRGAPTAATPAPAPPEAARGDGAAPRATTTPAPAQTQTQGGWGYYVYGVVTAGAAWEPMPGIDAAGDVYSLAVGRVRAVVSRVDLGTFGEGVFQEHLNDAGWLEQCVRAHQNVQAHVMEHATLVPMRFGIVFRSEAAVCDFLVRHEQALVETLARLAGREEWGVKLFARRRALTAWLAAQPAPSVAASGEPAAGPSEGRAYFARKRQEQGLADEAARLAHEQAALLHERLSALADAATCLPPQPPAGDELVLNAAYLLRPDALPGFEGILHERADALAEQGFTVERTGPWPPYSFVDLRFDT